METKYPMNASSNGKLFDNKDKQMVRHIILEDEDDPNDFRKHDTDTKIEWQPNEEVEVFHRHGP